MKRLLVTLLAAAALNSPLAAGELKPLRAEPVPVRKDGLAAALADRRGQPVLVNFWASWCPPCREEMPALARLSERWRSRGLTVLTVAVGDNAKVAEDYLWEIGVQLPLLLDQEQTTARAWGARALPTSFVLDRQHRKVLSVRGAIDWDAPEVERQLTTHLK